MSISWITIIYGSFEEGSNRIFYSLKIRLDEEILTPMEWRADLKSESESSDQRSMSCLVTKRSLIVKI